MSGQISALTFLDDSLIRARRGLVLVSISVFLVWFFGAEPNGILSQIVDIDRNTGYIPYMFIVWILWLKFAFMTRFNKVRPDFLSNQAFAVNLRYRYKNFLISYWRLLNASRYVKNLVEESESNRLYSDLYAYQNTSYEDEQSYEAGLRSISKSDHVMRNTHKDYSLIANLRAKNGRNLFFIEIVFPMLLGWLGVISAVGIIFNL